MLPLYISSCISLGLTLAAIMVVRLDYNNRKVLTNSTMVLFGIAYLFHASVVLWALSLSNWLTIPADTVLVLVGITITTIAILNIRTFQRMSGLQTDKLITDGIYAWSRNPQNLGWGLAMFGIAIIGHFGLALLLSALFGLAVHLYIVVLEEPYLESIYGEYRAKATRYYSISVDG